MSENSDEQNPDRTSEIIDIRHIPLLDDYWKSEAVTESIKNILDNLHISTDSISGWSSYIDGDVSNVKDRGTGVTPDDTQDRGGEN